MRSGFGPDPAYHFDVDPDADPDPDFYLMWMRIQVTKMLRIQVTKMLRIQIHNNGYNNTL